MPIFLAYISFVWGGEYYLVAAFGAQKVMQSDGEEDMGIAVTKLDMGLHNTRPPML